MKEQFFHLFGLTIREPAKAAEIVSNVRVDRITGWMILILAVTLNTLVYFLSTAIFPVPPEFAALPILTQPYLFWGMLCATTVIFVFAFYWIGRALDGQASFDAILISVGWLQYMRLAVQVAALILMIVAPALSRILTMVAGLYGLWVVMNFLKVVHGFDSYGKAIGVMILSAMGLTVGFSIFLSLMTAAVLGMS
ncbi:MAG: Yip1 family protein [Shimia sp.]|uniref:Yip1 family protein n=1 Tax=Shimia sp. TaxID=1954381 RepID=UPI004059F420